MNRFGGDVYLGVLDNGVVVGVPEKAAIDMVKNIINVVNNPTLFQPTTYLDPEIVKYEGKTIIRIHVPPSSEVLVREMISNTLMHREFTSSFQAKFIIERNRMFVENANRAPAQKTITPENLEPKPKNPTIASFFRNIGYADQLGSGVRKLFLYSKPYGGADPTFSEDDVFKITVSLNDMVGENACYNGENFEVNNRVNNKVNNVISENQLKIIDALRKNPNITQRELSSLTSISLVHINKNMKVLQEKGIVVRVGNNKQGTWVVNEIQNEQSDS
ncbi:MAG: winged helix-turn-helix transcriptional regulator [Fibrobacter sp.]|nr:winged helix-turn-helix transcriptional regulator [Fibrobacter sp.]